MFDKILVPLDGSGEAEVVLPYLRDLASRFGSQVGILGIGNGNKRRRVNHLLKEYVDEVAASLRTNSIEAESTILYGSPADKLLDYTDDNDFDLIIMATHGRGGITRWWVGSVAEKVISEALPSVLLLRSKRIDETEIAGELTFESILAPLDGSDIGEAALPSVEALALKTGASVSLLRVIPPLGAVESNIIGSDLRRFVGAMQDACEAYLSDVAQRLGDKGIETTYEVCTGTPADEIIEYAEKKKTSLIAMSTRGRSGVTRWMLGSVADKVLRGTKMPVWLVRSPRMISPTLKA